MPYEDVEPEVEAEAIGIANDLKEYMKESGLVVLARGVKAAASSEAEMYILSCAFELAMFMSLYEENNRKVLENSAADDLARRLFERDANYIEITEKAYDDPPSLIAMMAFCTDLNQVRELRKQQKFDDNVVDFLMQLGIDVS